MTCLTPWSRVLLEKLTDHQTVKKLPASYENRTPITVFTTASRLSLAWGRSIQSTDLLKNHYNIVIPSTFRSPTTPITWFLRTIYYEWPIPVASLSKAWVCDRSFAGIAGSNPTGGHECTSLVSVVCCLSGRSLCVGLITRSEESYRVWCVWVWSWSFGNEEALAHKGYPAMTKITMSEV
jgi:hypothetical protein